MNVVWRKMLQIRRPTRLPLMSGEPVTLVALKDTGS